MESVFLLRFGVSSLLDRIGGIQSFNLHRENPFFCLDRENPVFQHGLGESRPSLDWVYPVFYLGLGVFNILDWIGRISTSSLIGCIQSFILDCVNLFESKSPFLINSF